jgi:arylsulfatase A-like enzyme
MTSRCTFARWLLLAQTAWLAACSPAAPLHAILITIDTLRPDRLGAYGYAAASTPNFDALAASSIRFEQAYAHSSMTAPSIASLFTSLLPSQHGIYSNEVSLRTDLPSLVDSLDEAGFTTGAFIGSYALRAGRGFDRGFDSYTQDYGAVELRRKQPENLAGPLTDEAITWLERNVAANGQRLFLWIHYQEPHGPYTPPSFESPNPASENASIVLPRGIRNSGRRAIPRYQWLGHGRVAEYESRYDGEIAEFDRHLGRLVDALRSQGVLDRSVLVVTSDHGEAFGEEDLYCAHGEGLGGALLRVPLLLRAPEAVPAVRSDRVRLIDVPNTMLALLGLPDDDFAGTSLLAEEGDRMLVAQVKSLGNDHWRSVRDGDWELRQNAHRTEQLQRSVAPNPATPATDADTQVRDRLRATLDKSAPWPEARPDVPMSTEEESALKALGYID